MYLWTAAIAFPVTVWAFKPWWAAIVVAIFFGGTSVVIMKRKGQKVG